MVVPGVWLLFALLLAACSRAPSDFTLAPGQVQAESGTVTVWQPFELAVGSASDTDNPYVQGPTLQAEFTALDGKAEGRRLRVHGFWDGGNVWRLRFTPPAAGRWRYVTQSPDAAMHGHSGTLAAKAATAAARRDNPLLGGFLQAQGRMLRLSEGAPFFAVGDSQWSLLEEYTLDELRQWLDVLHRLGLNTVHGSVWLAKYTRSGLAPFRARDARAGRLDPRYFRALDEFVRDANARGIVPGLAIGGFPENTRWFEQFGDQARHDRWFRYVIDRYSAFNVRWLLFGEIDEASAPWLNGWEATSRYYARLVKARDPYGHPLGSHHTRVDAVAADNPDIDYIEVQIPRSETQYRTLRGYLRHDKPLWVEEYWYSPQAYDDDIAMGVRNTHRNFIAALGFPSMGGRMRAHAAHGDFAPAAAQARSASLADYLLAHDTGLRRLSEFKSFYDVLDLQAHRPWPEGCAAHVCARFGEDFAVFVDRGGSFDVDLGARAGHYRVRALDVQSGRVVELGRVQGGGVRRIDLPRNADTAVLLLRD